ncbi:hypothetical protein [Rhodoblastus sp.]|jgi:hypothetical protein|uniref:hypothetical protein n=1 Tax=Rhodoblastus sp. TaxID=1962975 RepID=UPI0025F11A8C|nr:hypothetical protein [Rhodoblastus sp.]
MILLDISIFTTADANWSRGLGPYVDGANYYLASFNIKLNVLPAASGPPVDLLLSGKMYDPPPDFNLISMRPGDLRAAAQTLSPSLRGLPVIFCKFNRSDAGLTTYTEDKAANRYFPWANYCMINEKYLNSDRAALLHEMIHASGYIGDIDPLWGRNIHDSQTGSIMRPNPDPTRPVQVFDRHARALEGAYFARAA